MSFDLQPNPIPLPPKDS